MTRTVIRRAGLAIAVFLTLAGVGATFAAFSDTTSNSSSPFTSASTFLQFVRNVGTAECGGTSDTVAVPAAGVDAGDTLVVLTSFRDRGGTGFAVSVSDSQGNTYQQDLTDSQAPVRADVYSAYITNALGPGDTITVTHPDLDANAVVVTEFRGIDAAGRVDQTATDNGNSATPTASLTTTNPNDVVVGFVTVADSPSSVTQPGGWSALPSMNTDCGIPPPHTLESIHAAYRIVSSTGTYTYNPTLSGISRWDDLMASYKG
jgi:hypothetical protein